MKGVQFNFVSNKIQISGDKTTPELLLLNCGHKWISFVIIVFTSPHKKIWCFMSVSVFSDHIYYEDMSYSKGLGRQLELNMD